MLSKKSETVILQGFSCVVNIIVDEHNNQPRVSCSNQFGPRPAMPEPQMHPYRVIKRYGDISRCHGCCAKYDKKKTTMILFRKEIDWRSDVNKLFCLMNRRQNLEEKT